MNHIPECPDIDERRGYPALTGRHQGITISVERIQHAYYQARCSVTIGGARYFSISDQAHLFPVDAWFEAHSMADRLSRVLDDCAAQAAETD